MTHETQPPFEGFHSGETNLIRLPETFFTQLMPLIDDPTHLRLLLYLFWHQERQGSKVHYFRLEDLADDPALVQMTGGRENLEDALNGLMALGAVLRADFEWMDETYYFINGPQGRAAVEAIKSGEWLDPNTEHPPIHLTGSPPNIYKLYEENIGVITPMMAEILKADEAAYPKEWIEEAIRIAVARNVRNWKYIQAILERWQKEGHGNEQNRRDNSQDSISYRESWLGDN